MPAVQNKLLFSRTKANRRQFLRPFALLPFWMSASHSNAQLDPLEEGRFQLTDLGSLEALLTPNSEFYVRNHFAVPVLRSSEWSLHVAGQVQSTMEINLAGLNQLPHRTITATLECAGNGVGQGGVSTATWTGVPLGELLRKAGLRPGVKQIRLVGADSGRQSSALPFGRSIPLEKALHPDTLLAFQMNGKDLPEAHGHPVRAVVPGWYAMDSVKWLVRIEALDREDASFFMASRYLATRLESIGTDQSPVTRMRVKSVILQPRDGEILPLGASVICGQAWAGERFVAKVEVSTNGGADWFPASLDGKQQPYTWVQWRYSWVSRSPGTYTLMARASDAAGATQPATRDPQRLDGYEMNAYHRVQCLVR